jgi:hypothetical protein
MIIIVEYQYFAPIYLYKSLFKDSHVVFERYEHFQKMSFRNRCQLAGAEGLVSLSIPLVNGRNQRALISEVQIDYKTNWQVQHWRTIEACYRRSPWFEYFENGLSLLFREKPTLLVDWNEMIFNWTTHVLGMQVQTGHTENFVRVYPEGFMDLRDSIQPKNAQQKILPRYEQVFSERGGFISNLSILDLLFCLGPGAIDFLAF